ncbi:MAG: hypothetical protein JW723_04690 [Bacteroidales bacterium]|nr:hypothetical protein [Bacteroidales bacterium]
MTTVETRTPFADFKMLNQLKTKNKSRLGNMHQLITRGRRFPISIFLGKEITSRL